MWIWKTAKQRVEGFLRDKEPQSDAEFLAGCELPPNAGAERVALGVRRVIATLGQVEAKYIHWEAVFAKDINYLPFWCSLDTVGIVLELEKEFGLPIPNEDAEAIRNPELEGGHLTVKDFVHDVCRVIGQRIST